MNKYIILKMTVLTMKNYFINYIFNIIITATPVPRLQLNAFYPAISTFAVQICYTNTCLLYSY